MSSISRTERADALLVVDILNVHRAGASGVFEDREKILPLADKSLLLKLPHVRRLTGFGDLGPATMSSQTLYRPLPREC
jgi:hypothetical protein